MATKQSAENEASAEVEPNANSTDSANKRFSRLRGTGRFLARHVVAWLATGLVAGLALGQAGLESAGVGIALIFAVLWIAFYYVLKRRGPLSAR